MIEGSGSLPLTNGRSKNIRIRIRNTVGTVRPAWLPVVDVEVEDPGDEVGEEGRHPVHQEHGRHAQQRSEQGQQRVVVLNHNTKRIQRCLPDQAGFVFNLPPRSGSVTRI
jgi:hypothetical protein